MIDIAYEAKEDYNLLQIATDNKCQRAKVVFVTDEEKRAWTEIIKTTLDEYKEIESCRNWISVLCALEKYMSKESTRSNRKHFANNIDCRIAVDANEALSFLHDSYINPKKDIVYKF